MSNIRVRNLAGMQVRAVPAADDLALINAQYARVPLEEGDLHIRSARVAHNQHDRTLERFPKAMLERFAETLPGKSLLPGHDTSALPLGRWFRADTRTRTEEFPCLVPGKNADAGAEKAAELVPGFEPKSQRVTWLEGAFYFTAGPETEQLRRNIDSGVYQDVSIGFKYDDVDCDLCKKSYLRSDCPHLRGQRTADGQLVTLTYSGDPKQYEARETSIVYLGAQQQAELMKSLRDGTVDPQAWARTPWGTDLVSLKEAEGLARKHGHQQKSWAFPALQVSPSLDGDAPPPLGGNPTDTPAAVAAKGDTEMALLEEVRRALKLPAGATESEALKAIETVALERPARERAEERAEKAEAEVKSLQPKAEVGETALKDLREAVLADDLRLTGAKSPELEDLTTLLVERGNYARLKEYAAAKRAAVLEKFPAGVSADLADATRKPEPKAEARPTTTADLYAGV